MNRLHSYKVPLGEQANTVLIAIVKRSSMDPENLLRAAAEEILAAARQDHEIEEGLVEEARHIKQTGFMPASYWRARYVPRADGLIVDRHFAQEEAPDDVPEYRPPATYWRHRSIKPGKHRVTVEFSEAAYAGLGKRNAEHLLTALTG